VIGKDFPIALWEDDLFVLSASFVNELVHSFMEALFVVRFPIAALIEDAVCFEAEAFERFGQIAGLGIATSF
jgi:hypothetical protein